jgi:hypothetical protein
MSSVHSLGTPGRFVGPIMRCSSTLQLRKASDLWWLKCLITQSLGKKPAYGLGFGFGLFTCLVSSSGCQLWRVLFLNTEHLGHLLKEELPWPLLLRPRDVAQTIYF